MKISKVLFLQFGNILSNCDVTSCIACSVQYLKETCQKNKENISCSTELIFCFIHYIKMNIPGNSGSENNRIYTFSHQWSVVGEITLSTLSRIKTRNTVSNAHKMIPPAPQCFVWQSPCFALGNPKIMRIKI